MELIVKVREAREQGQGHLRDYVGYGRLAPYEELIDENGMRWVIADEIPRYKTYPFGGPALSDPIIGILDEGFGLLHIEKEVDMSDYLLDQTLGKSRNTNG
jgi:hypothetical protein